MKYVVNGHEVKVGQIWRTRSVGKVKITNISGDAYSYPIEGQFSDNDTHVSYTSGGMYYQNTQHDFDLLSPVVEDVAPDQKKPLCLYVNGHQVKVGQVWRTVSACNVTITSIEDEECSYPIEATGAPPDFDALCFTKDGVYFAGEISSFDLVCPVEEVQPTIGQKFDQGKLRPTLLFQSLPNAVHQTIEVLQYGANKYGDENWKQVEPHRYKDALLRHILKYLSGIERDEESGLKELAHISSNVMVLLEHEAMLENKEKN